jgi:hypothetical protein
VWDGKTAMARQRASTAASVGFGSREYVSRETLKVLLELLTPRKQTGLEKWLEPKGTGASFRAGTMIPGSVLGEFGYPQLNRSKAFVFNKFEP